MCLSLLILQDKKKKVTKIPTFSVRLGFVKGAVDCVCYNQWQPAMSESCIQTESRPCALLHTSKCDFGMTPNQMWSCVDGTDR